MVENVIFLTRRLHTISFTFNELLLNCGYATIYQDFCNISEYSLAGWADLTRSDFDQLTDHLNALQEQENQ